MNQVILHVTCLLGRLLLTGFPDCYLTINNTVNNSGHMVWGQMTSKQVVCCNFQFWTKANVRWNMESDTEWRKARSLIYGEAFLIQCGFIDLARKNRNSSRLFLDMPDVKGTVQNLWKERLRHFTKLESNVSYKIIKFQEISSWKNVSNLVFVCAVLWRKYSNFRAKLRSSALRYQKLIPVLYF